MAIFSSQISFCRLKDESLNSNDWQEKKMCEIAGYLNDHPLSASKSVSEFTTECKEGCDKDSNCKVAFANTADGTKTCTFYGNECKPGADGCPGNYIYVKRT